MKTSIITAFLFVAGSTLLAQSTLRFDSLISFCDLSPTCTLYYLNASIINYSGDTVLIDVDHEFSDAYRILSLSIDSCFVNVYPDIRARYYISSHDDNRIIPHYGDPQKSIVKYCDCRPNNYLWQGPCDISSTRKLHWVEKPILISGNNKKTIPVFFLLDSSAKTCSSMDFHFVAYTKSKGLHLISVDPNGLFP